MSKNNKIENNDTSDSILFESEMLLTTRLYREFDAFDTLENSIEEIVKCNTSLSDSINRYTVRGEYR